MRVAVLNDYEVVAQGVRSMLSPWSDRLEVVHFDMSSELRQPVDIALLDMFGQDRSELPRVRAQLNAVGVRKVVAYSWHFTLENARALLEAGASGVISKGLPAATLAEALMEVAAGHTVMVANEWTVRADQPPAPVEAAEYRSDWPGREYGLTMREAEMIALITQGLTNADIAKRAFLSGNTVKSYIRAAYRKIGVTRRAEAVAWGLRHQMRPSHSAARAATGR